MTTLVLLSLRIQVGTDWQQFYLKLSWNKPWEAKCVVSECPKFSSAWVLRHFLSFYKDVNCQNNLHETLSCHILNNYIKKKEGVFFICLPLKKFIWHSIWYIHFHMKYNMKTNFSKSLSKMYKLLNERCVMALECFLL